MMYDFKKKMGIICHDAGAANVLISALKKMGTTPVIALMEGPARDLWSNTFPDIPCNNQLIEIIDSASCIFTGSGWSSSLEFDAILLSNKKGLFCSTVIDHWVNYKERFNRRGRNVLPNRFIVTDSEAYKIACQNFPQTKVIQCKNFYLEEQVKKIFLNKRKEKKQLLYICEPIRSMWGRDKEGEFQALDYFLETIHQLQIPKEYSIMLRPHPSESINKYKSIISESDYLIKISKKLDIAEDIAEASFIFGCNSYGMVISLAANKPTYSVIPPWGPPSSLPHNKIKPLTSLIF